MAVVAADPLSALVLVLTYPLIPLFMALIGGAARERTERQWLQMSRMSARFLDALQGFATLKAFGRAGREGEAIAAASERFRALTMGVLRIAFLSALVLELLATLSVAVVAVEIGLRLLHGHIAFDHALFVLILAPEYYRPLRTLGAGFHAGMAGRAVEAQARDLLEAPLPPGVPAPRPATAPEFRLDGPPEIVFEDVSFRYAADRPPALAAVSFRIAPGTMLALAGPSGAGKSTAAQLLLGFLEPATGVIRVNGMPLSALDPREWRRHVAWVPQHPHLFHGSVLDNLRVARPGATPEELRRALELAGIAAFIDALPRGLDTPIGEQGERLSGGQAQGLALARALLRATPLLVLDEPTAQLDPEIEARVMDGMRRLARGRTVLLIAHRRRTLAGADGVVRLSGGRVVQAGPADALYRPDPGVPTPEPGAGRTP